MSDTVAELRAAIDHCERHGIPISSGYLLRVADAWEAAQRAAQARECCAEDLAAARKEIAALRAELAESKRHLLADEERRKLTGDALFAEGEAIRPWPLLAFVTFDVALPRCAMCHRIATKEGDAAKIGARYLCDEHAGTSAAYWDARWADAVRRLEGK